MKESLVWNQLGNAHGTFNVVNGSGDGTYTVDEVLADNTDGADAGWNGKSLTKTGSGTLILAKDNGYSGGTIVNGGLIAFNSTNNLGTGKITLNDGGLRWLTGNSADISDRLNALGTGGATFDTNGNNVNFANAVTGNDGSLTKAGSGTLTLTGANNDIGNMTIGDGSLTKNGTGTLTLNADNAYTGGTSVGAGTLVLKGAGSIATSSGLILKGADQAEAVFDIGAISGNGYSQIVLGGKGLEINTAGNGTFAGVIGGNGSLTKDGEGTLTLTGDNTYSGGPFFEEEGGKITVGSATALGSGAVTMEDETALGFADSYTLETPSS
jgi:autotransporter-associated beta strand protein